MTFIPDLESAALTLQADLYPDTHAQHIIGALMNRITYLEQACDSKDRLNANLCAAMRKAGVSLSGYGTGLNVNTNWVVKAVEDHRPLHPEEGE